MVVWPNSLGGPGVAEYRTFSAAVAPSEVCEAQVPANLGLGREDGEVGRGSARSPTSPRPRSR